jgi:hypothetical protein
VASEVDFFKKSYAADNGGGEKLPNCCLKSSEMSATK